MASASFYELLKKLDATHARAASRPQLTAAARLGSFAAYRGLELALGERHPHERVVAQARALQQAWSGSRPEQGPRALFFAVRGWYPAVTMQAILAKALELRGVRPTFLLCDGVRPQCDFKPSTDDHTTRPLCWRCTGYPRRLLEAFDLPTLWMSEQVDGDAHARARSRVQGKSLAELQELEHLGLPIGDHCMASLSRSLLIGDPTLEPKARRVLAGFVEGAQVMAEACERVLDEVRPEVVVLNNGLFSVDRVMFEMARARGIRVVTHEVGWRVGTVHFANDQRAGEIPLDGPWSRRSDRALDDDERKKIEELLASRRGGGSTVKVYWPEMKGDADSIRGQLAIPAQRKLAVAFTNILWDTAVFRRDVAFDGMFDWLRASIELFASRPDWHLVIRVHPAELRWIMQESREPVVPKLRAAFPTLPENVTIIPPDDATNSYALVDASDAVLAYTSTLGIEAAAAGRNVVTAGKVHYAGRGFTHDVLRRADYASVIERAFASEGLPDAQRELALRYGYMLFFEHMRPFPWMVAGPREERRLTFERLDELAPGRDADLDEICEGVLGNYAFTPTVDAGGG